jgi:hypothetical protein
MATEYRVDPKCSRRATLADRSRRLEVFEPSCGVSHQEPSDPWASGDEPEGHRPADRWKGGRQVRSTLQSEDAIGRNLSLF